MDEKKIRINKYIADAGICSRRDADKLVEQGLVKVNGRFAESGTKVFSFGWDYRSRNYLDCN